MKLISRTTRLTTRSRLTPAGRKIPFFAFTSTQLNRITTHPESDRPSLPLSICRPLPRRLLSHFSQRIEAIGIRDSKNNTKALILFALHRLKPPFSLFPFQEMDSHRSFPQSTVNCKAIVQLCEQFILSQIVRCQSGWLVVQGGEREHWLIRKRGKQDKIRNTAT